ncbi:MAG: YbaK/EbsC family protein [Deltaproteobacteria bacterium]|nr:YbaK/EbsC family protein [Deltaproteobacteria bacterium]
MPIVKKLLEYLKKNNIAFKHLNHPEAFTSQQVAQAQHVSGNQFAKVVIVKNGKKFEMAVLPAPDKISIEKLKNLMGVKECRLATEPEMKELFPDCEVGSMPPFGNLYNMNVYVDQDLAIQSDIVFDAGSHKDTIQMKYQDFSKLVKPQIGKFGILETKLKLAA